MVRFTETPLPGVGVRYDFITEEGRRIGVITRHSGRRDFFVCDSDDADSCTEVLHLHEADRAALVELLGGSEVGARLVDLQQRVEGLAIDWVTLNEGWAAAGRTIADTELRRRTGVSIVAILRDDRTVPSPEPSEPLLAGDTVVVVGTPEGIETAVRALRDG